MSVAAVESLDERADGQPQTPRRRGMRVALLATIWATITFGLALRVWVALGPLGVLNADEVITALMARDLLDGNLTAFYWGQAYGGTIEVIPLAVSMAVLGEDAGVVALVLLEVVVIASLLYALARRHLDRPFALGVVALYAVTPASSVWFSTRPMGFYGPVVILGLGAMVVAAQLNDADRTNRDRLARFMVLGALLGVGWWTSAQILFFAVPIMYSLIRRRTVRTLAEGGAFAGGAVLGAIVWISYNLRNRGQSLRELPPSDGSTFDHVRAQIERGWPMVVGARRPFDERWLLPGGGWVFAAVAIAAALGIALVFWRNPSLRSPLAGMTLAFPLLHAFAPTGSFVGNGRYYYFVVPALAYVVIAALSRLRPTWRDAAVILVVVFAAITTTLTLTAMRDLQFGPERVDDVAEALLERDVSDVYANYWIGYPLAWADSDIRVTTDHTDRRPDWAAQVRSAERTAYVFWLPYADDAQRYSALEPLLRAVGIEETFDVGGYRVVIPVRNVPPERLDRAEPAG